MTPDLTAPIDRVLAECVEARRQIRAWVAEARRRVAAWTPREMPR